MNSREIRAYKVRNKARMEELVRIAWQYQDMLEELDSLVTVAPEMDGMPRGTTTGDPVHAAAVRRERLADRVMAIERCARMAGGDCYDGLLLGVTTRGSSYNWLKMTGKIYCGRDQYYIMRTKFFYLLNLAI